MRNRALYKMEAESDGITSPWLKDRLAVVMRGYSGLRQLWTKDVGLMAVLEPPVWGCCDDAR
jgi:hypothetical protein